MNRALAAILLFVTASLAAAQGNSGTKVHVKRALLDNETLVLDLRIDPTWHIYAVNGDGTVGNATKLAVDKPFEIAGAVTEPKPKHHKKDYLDEDKKEILYTEEYDAHEGEIQLRIPVRGAGATLKGSLTVTACDADHCLESGSVKFSAERGPTAAPTAAPTGAPVAVPAADTRATTPTTPEKAGASRPSRKVVKNPTRLGKVDANDPFKIVEISYPDPISSDRVEVRFVVEIAPGYHVYGFTKASAGTNVPTSITFSKPAGQDPPVVLVRNGEPKSDPAPQHHVGKIDDYESFEGKVTFDVPVRAMWANCKAPAGPAEVAFTFRPEVEYQTCTMDYCLAPATASFDLSATAVGLPEGAAIGDSSVGADAKADCAALDVKVSSEPATLQPDSTAMLTARVRRMDGKALTAEGLNSTISLGQGTNLSVDGSTSAMAESDGSVTLRLPIHVAAEATDGTIAVSGRVAIGTSTADFAGSFKVMSPLLGFLLIAALSALGALLTPCVFPMIPVTMSFFTKQAESGDRHPAKLALVYCAGIVASFTAIGALFTLALSGDAANVFAGHWITQLVITALFVFFSLSLLGMFDLAVPAPIMNMVERTTTRRMELVDKGKGVMVAVLLMGLLFSITTFTCTAPFIGGLLASASASGHYTKPILGMLTFSAVLAVPFFFLAVFPAQLKKLPKAGGWLNETKVVMGFIELAAAVKFLNGADYTLGWGIFTRNVCLSIWTAIFGLTGLYLIGLIRLPKDMPRQKTGVIPLILAMTFITIAIFLTTGLNGKPLGKFIEGWLPPIERQFTLGAESAGPGEGSAGPAAGRTGWDGRFEDDYEGALKEAKSRGLPLFIDFTGFNCANCRAVEATILHSNRDVRQLLQGVVAAELHLDGGPAKEKNIELITRFGLPNQTPVYVVLDPTYDHPINNWGWLDAEPKKWKPQVKDALDRWKTLKH